MLRRLVALSGAFLVLVAPATATPIDDIRREGAIKLCAAIDGGGSASAWIGIVIKNIQSASASEVHKQVALTILGDSTALSSLEICPQYATHIESALKNLVEASKQQEEEQYVHYPSI